MTNLRASMGSVQLVLPGDDALLAAAGRAALAHGQLELMLRMTVKTLAGLTVKEALDATEKSKSWELRKDILALFKRKTSDPSLHLKLRSILGRCQKLSDERNRLLHNAWALAPNGSVVAKGTDHAWGPAATADDLNRLASEIAEQARILNDARLHGFIRDACPVVSTVGD